MIAVGCARLVGPRCYDDVSACQYVLVGHRWVEARVVLWGNTNDLRVPGDLVYGLLLE